MTPEQIPFINAANNTLVDTSATEPETLKKLNNMRKEIFNTLRSHVLFLEEPDREETPSHSLS